MREMIVSELTQAVQELAREFARFLPRLIVLVIIAFAGCDCISPKDIGAEHSSAHSI